MKSVNLSELLQEKSVRAESLPDYESLPVLGVSNKVGITVTNHKKSKELAAYKLIEEGDFAYNPYRINVGSIGLTPNGVRGLVSPAYVVFSTKETLSPELLLNFLKSSEGLFQISKYSRGTVRKSLRFKDLCQISIVLPPMEKQRLILQERKKIQYEEDALKREIALQQELIKKLRQQILQEAVEGKLTADWRAQHHDVETASELLARIQMEKAQLIKAKKISKQNQLPPISEEEKPFALPDVWVWCRLENLSYENPRNGYSPKSVDFITETKTLKLGATSTGKFIEKEIKYINESIGKDSFLWLDNRDILIQRANSIDFVGVSAIYYGDRYKFIYPDLMMKIKPVILIHEQYLHHFLMSPFCRQYFRDNATGAQKSMPKINQGIVSNTLISLPPLPEQKVIVAKVEKLLALCDQLEHEISQNQSRAEQLMQAVLSEAFSQPSEQAKQPAAFAERVTKPKLDRLFLKPPADQPFPGILPIEQQGFSSYSSL
jgi:type I restriction enzyme S subunit